MRPHLTRTTVITLLLGMGLSACSSSDPEPGADARPSERATSGSSGAADAPPVGPLDEYIGVGTRSADSEAGLDLRIAEAIARCMAAEGFEYVPYVDTGFDATVTADGQVFMQPADFPDLPPDEFAQQFGYGLSTKQLGARRSAEQVDPNTAIVAAMSVAERVAYHQAYYGRQIALDDEGYLAGTSISNSDESCSGQAYALEPTDKERARTEKRIARVQDSFATLLDRVRELRAQREQDPRVAAATATWGGCLAAAGHPGFTALAQPRAQIRAQAVQLLGDDLSAEGVDAKQLAALRSAEIELAVADETCLTDWRRTYDAVGRDLEEGFVRENLPELEAFRSAMSAAVADQE